MECVLIQGHEKEELYQHGNIIHDNTETFITCRLQLNVKKVKLN